VFAPEDHDPVAGLEVEAEGDFLLASFSVEAS
jgi:hypothetical protein